MGVYPLTPLPVMPLATSARVAESKFHPCFTSKMRMRVCQIETASVIVKKTPVWNFHTGIETKGFQSETNRRTRALLGDLFFAFPNGQTLFVGQRKLKVVSGLVRAAGTSICFDDFSRNNVVHRHRQILRN